MRKKRFILVINPQYGYTKVAIFNIKGEYIVSDNLEFRKEEDKKIYEQKDKRKIDILFWLKKIGVTLGEILAIVGRGGILRPIPGGTYKITSKMLEDLKNAYAGEHVSNLGAVIAYEIARKVEIPSFIVDPMTVDEMDDVARISGLPYIERKALSNALNIKYVAQIISNRLEKPINKTSFVVAHLGQDFSIVALKHGKIIDTNNFYDEGPFSLQRCGGIPPLKIVDEIFMNKYDLKEFLNKVFNKSGLVEYFGTDNIKEIEKYIEKDEKDIEFILDAMAYNISKEIGAISAALNFQMDRIILTGSLSHNKRITSYIENKVGFISKVEIVPGKYQMEALASGVLRVLNGVEKAKIYENEVCL